jgi:hypothetical protein
MAAEAADDMDIFVGVQKLDARGRFVGMAYYAMFDDGRSRSDGCARPIGSSTPRVPPTISPSFPIAAN